MERLRVAVPGACDPVALVPGAAWPGWADPACGVAACGKASRLLSRKSKLTLDGASGGLPASLDKVCAAAEIEHSSTRQASFLFMQRSPEQGVPPCDETK